MLIMSTKAKSTGRLPRNRGGSSNGRVWKRRAPREDCMSSSRVISHIHLYNSLAGDLISDYMKMRKSEKAGGRPSAVALMTWINGNDPDRLQVLLDRVQKFHVCSNRECRTNWGRNELVVPVKKRKGAIGFVTAPKKKDFTAEKERKGFVVRHLAKSEVPDELMNPMRPKKGVKNGLRFGRGRYNETIHALFQGPTVERRAERFRLNVRKEFHNMSFYEFSKLLSEKYALPEILTAVNRNGHQLFGEQLDNEIGFRPTFSAKARQQKLDRRLSLIHI